MNALATVAREVTCGHTIFSDVAAESAKSKHPLSLSLSHTHTSLHKCVVARSAKQTSLRVKNVPIGGEAFAPAIFVLIRRITASQNLHRRPSPNN